MKNAALEKYVLVMCKIDANKAQEGRKKPFIVSHGSKFCPL